MRLDFNVLWVEDQPERVAAQITSLTKRLQEEGFKLNPTLLRSLEDIEALLAGDVFRDEVDLILVDWDLGGGLHGQDVIAKIREVVQYKDVVFYSAHTHVGELRKLAFEAGVEGVYCVLRADLLEEFMGVFDSLVKKVLDLDHTRGIVMGATSDIDHMVLSCITHIEAKLDDAGKKKLVGQAIERVNDRVQDIAKQGAKLGSVTSVEKILKAHMIFTAKDRLRLLSSLLEADEKHAETAQMVKSYMEEVVPDRNALGHKVLVPEGKPQAVEIDEGKLVNLDEMRQLRKLILGLREDFRTLTETLKA